MQISLSIVFAAMLLFSPVLPHWFHVPLVENSGPLPPDPWKP